MRHKWYALQHICIPNDSKGNATAQHTMFAEIHFRNAPTPQEFMYLVARHEEGLLSKHQLLDLEHGQQIRRDELFNELARLIIPVNRPRMRETLLNLFWRNQPYFNGTSHNLLRNLRRDIYTSGPITRFAS
jgi:hypothetical protein